MFAQTDTLTLSPDCMTIYSVLSDAADVLILIKRRVWIWRKALIGEGSGCLYATDG